MDMAFRRPPGWHWSFLIAAGVVIAAVTADPFFSSILSIRTWERIGLQDAPLRLAWFLPLLALAGAAVLHLALKAPDLRSGLLVLTIVAMQCNGIKLLPGLDLITMLPFLVGLYVLAEAMRRPDERILFGGVMFFALFFLLLDLPYLATLHVYGPPRFIINFISALKAFLLAFVMVNLIRDRGQFNLAVRSLIIVAVISATIGVLQIYIHHRTGMILTLVAEDYRTKPTFFGVSMRATGLTTWPSWLADFLLMAFPFLLYRFVDASGLRARLAMLAGMAMLLTAIFFTFTYAAYAGIVAIVLLFPFFRWPRRIPFFLTTILVLGALAYLVGGLEWAYDQFDRKILGSTGMIERKVYLQAAIDQLVRDPWLGSGFYADEEFSANFYRKRVHNTGVQAWVYLGLPGLLAFLAMMMIVLTQLGLLAGARTGLVRHHLQALILGLVGAIVAMFAEPNFTAPVTWFQLGLCQAAILVYNRPSAEPPSG